MDKTEQTRCGTVEGYLGLLILVIYFTYPMLVSHPPLWVDLTEGASSWRRNNSGAGRRGRRWRAASSRYALPLHLHR